MPRFDQVAIAVFLAVINQSACYEVADLDDDGINWGFFEDGDRKPQYSAIYSDGGSDLTFFADEDTLAYSMIHFYKNSYLPNEELQGCAQPEARPAKEFCFSTKWSYGVASDITDPLGINTSYDQPTPFNNECLPGKGCWTSKIQAIEFSASRWECSSRNEVALQWCNVCARDGDWHSGVPVWRYWNQGWQTIPDACGINEALSRLPHNILHDLEVCALIDGQRTTYTRLSLNQNEIDLSQCISSLVDIVPSSTTGNLLAAAIQHDGTSRNHPFQVHVEDMKLTYN